MSMLSAQTKRLRKVADDLDFYTITRDIHTASILMRDAADTIDELRERLQETCHNAHQDSIEDLAVWFECSECGVTYIEVTPMNFCPSCGRRVVG